MLDDRDLRGLAAERAGQDESRLLWWLAILVCIVALLAAGVLIAALVDRVLPVLVALSGAMQ